MIFTLTTPALKLSTLKVARYAYEHPHPAVATDIVLLTLRDHTLEVLLIQRGQEPFKSSWALPGGFLRPDEDLDTCATRELFEETGVETPLRPFANFSAPDRDPRERVISVAYLALLRADQVAPMAGSDAAAVQWFKVSEMPPLAFDHVKIIDSAIASLKRWVEEDDALLDLLPEKFKFAEIKEAYEAVTSTVVDGPNFRVKILAKGTLQETDEFVRGKGRPARLYTRVHKG